MNLLAVHSKLGVVNFFQLTISFFYEDPLLKLYELQCMELCNI